MCFKWYILQIFAVYIPKLDLHFLHCVFHFSPLCVFQWYYKYLQCWNWSSQYIERKPFFFKFEWIIFLKEYFGFDFELNGFEALFNFWMNNQNRWPMATCSCPWCTMAITDVILCNSSKKLCELKSWEWGSLVLERNVHQEIVHRIQSEQIFCQF